MSTPYIVVLWLYVSLFFFVNGFEDKLKTNCETCDDISKNFKLGLDRTAKANFGGGNTHWEESRLGSFQFSETRLVDIQEKLCKDVRHTSTCHTMAEAQEEIIEEWWFKVYKLDPDKADLRSWLCVDKLKLCCPHGQFGSECKVCPTCSGRGTCAGNGTRTGDGKCECEVGYHGDACSQCASDYFISKNASESQLLTCDICDSACNSEKGCTGEGPDRCKECATGYTREKDGDSCVDVDECQSADKKCAENQYCVNNPGSYTCEQCDRSCGKGCTGSSNTDCDPAGGCASGYELHSNRCQDRDECKVGDSTGAAVCTGQHELCSNSPPGSYTCDCKPGYHRPVSGQPCVKVPVVNRKSAGSKQGSKGGGDQSQEDEENTSHVDDIDSDTASPHEEL